MAENVKIVHFCHVSAFDGLCAHFSEQRLAIVKLLYSLLSLMMSKAIVMLPLPSVQAIFKWL